MVNSLLGEGPIGVRTGAGPSAEQKEVLCSTILHPVILYCQSVENVPYSGGR